MSSMKTEHGAIEREIQNASLAAREDAEKIEKAIDSLAELTIDLFEAAAAKAEAWRQSYAARADRRIEMEAGFRIIQATLLLIILIVLATRHF